MREKMRASPFPLRLSENVKEEARVEANKNRRSLNAEIGLLIEEGAEMAGDTEQAGSGLKMKKPQRGNAEASGVTTLQEFTR